MTTKEFCDRTNELKCRCLHNSSAAPPIISLHAMIRKIFADHMIYITAFTKASIFENPDVLYMKKRVLENANDIGMNLGRIPTVGSDNGTAITEEFVQHILLSENCITLAKSYYCNPSVETKDRMDQMDAVLLQQGDRLAMVISNIDAQKLPFDGMQKEIKVHNQQELELAKLLLEGRYQDEAKACDEALNHFMATSDLIYFAVH